MYTRAIRKEMIDSYACLKSLLASTFIFQPLPLDYLRFQYPHDYSKPKIKSQFPGPLHEEALQNIQSYNIDQIYQVKRFVDLKKSKGNFFKDIDGNVVLDLHGNYGANPLGYNHDALINARDSELYDRFLSKSTNVTNLPPHDYADILRETVMPIAPEGMRQVFLTDGTMTHANESALLLGITKYAKDHNVSDMSRLCVLGFENGYHGSSIGTLSCSDSSANIQSVGTYDWPRAPFPQMKYPFVEHEKENQQEMDRCLSEVKNIISQRKNSGKDVASIIIEPVSSINTVMATPYFYKQLRKIAKDNGIPFIVDETKTGVGSTGKMWGHDHWYLSDHPDLVTFGGKAGISGYYTTLEYRQQDYGLNFEQTVDMIKLLNYGVVWKYIQKKDLLNLVQDTSTFLKIELSRIARDKGVIRNVRGYGTVIGFDTNSERVAESVQGYFFKTGIHLLRSGPQTFGMRPALILEPKHAAQLRESLMHYHPNYRS